MASYIIAGKADDVSFARAEFAAKQIEASCPNIFFHFEMKHPDMWYDFIKSVFRKYDFDGYPDDFPGPLVWTHEGTLIGGSAEFIQQVCLDKFGIPNPPAVTDPMFKEIAKDNLKQVKVQKDREKHGLPFGEKCEAAQKTCSANNLFFIPVWDEQKRIINNGAPMEVWISRTLSSEREKIRSEYGNGEAAVVDPGLVVSVTGREQSHTALLHPQPLVPKHLVLPPRRFVTDSGSSLNQKQQPMLEVQPHRFRYDTGEDLGEADFIAAMEVMCYMGGVPGMACWMGLRGASEYRHPLDTHLQVLPFPVHSAGEDSPLRYPLELICEKAVKDGEKSLKAFPFPHSFTVLMREGVLDLAREALAAYEQARPLAGKNTPRDSFYVAFTTTWLMLVPLTVPDQESARHEAWLQMPPPPPCALSGIMVCPFVQKRYPETAALACAGTQVVSTRAEEEGIPEGSPEFEAANRQVCIASKIMDMPLEILRVWTSPGPGLPK